MRTVCWLSWNAGRMGQQDGVVAAARRSRMSERYPRATRFRIWLKQSPEFGTFCDSAQPAMDAEPEMRDDRVDAFVDRPRHDISHADRSARRALPV
jgi:hypothetical protein